MGKANVREGKGKISVFTESKRLHKGLINNHIPTDEMYEYPMPGLGGPCRRCRDPVTDPVTSRGGWGEHGMKGREMVEEARHIFKKCPLDAQKHSEEHNQKTEVCIRTLQPTLKPTSAPIRAGEATNDGSRAQLS